MQDISFPLIVLPALILAISFSAPLFLRTLSPGGLGEVMVPTTTMFASAICLSALAFAIEDHGLAAGTVIAITSLLISRAIRFPDGVLPTVLSAILFAIYLQVRFASV